MKATLGLATMAMVAASMLAVGCGKKGGNAQNGASLYQAHCASCHGTSGLGDGPAGVPLGATNLTDPAMHARLTDEQMAERIRKGGTKMPPNPALDDRQIADVVAHVRTLRR